MMKPTGLKINSPVTIFNPARLANRASKTGLAGKKAIAAQRAANIPPNWRQLALNNWPLVLYTKRESDFY
jgi:hypothetical protein